VKKNSSPELPIISIALPIPGDKRDGFSSTEAPGRRAPGLAAAFSMSDRAFAQTTTDLAVTCDAGAAPAVIAAGSAFRQRTGVRIRVFPTALGLVLPQLEREIQNDIIVTQTATIDQADRAGLVEPGGRVGPWRNRLVTAAAKQPSGVEGLSRCPIPRPPPTSTALPSCDGSVLRLLRSWG
jgi:Bacterial extracellular solute-binding protein